MPLLPQLSAELASLAYEWSLGVNVFYFIQIIIHMLSRTFRLSVVYEKLKMVCEAEELGSHA